MSYLKNQLAGAWQKIIVRAGTPLMIQYFTTNIGSVYDDDVSLTQSGTNLWTSGIVLPLARGPGNVDGMLLEQGKLLEGDLKLYLHGSLILGGSEMMMNITVGSPPSADNRYSLSMPLSKRFGPYSYSVQNTPIYKQMYIRRIYGTGSLFGE